MSRTGPDAFATCATCAAFARSRLRLHGRFGVLVTAGVLAWTLYAVATAPAPEQAARTSWGAVALGSFLLSLRLTSSLVAEEVHSGVWLLWAQTGASPVALYLRRLGVCMLLSLGVVMVLSGTAALALALVPGEGGAAPALIRRAPALAIAVLLQGILVWACSGWGIRADASVGFLLFLVLAGLEVAVKLEASFFGALAPWVDAVGLPVDALGELAGGAWSPAATVGAWSLSWLLVGAAGTVLTTRRRSWPGGDG
ncbi:MAG TPA: hypothetical protein VGA70_15075 [Longimicrobiales bacterium]